MRDGDIVMVMEIDDERWSDDGRWKVMVMMTLLCMDGTSKIQSNSKNLTLA